MKVSDFISLVIIVTVFFGAIIFTAQQRDSFKNQIDDLQNHLIEVGVMEYNPKTGELGFKEEFKIKEEKND